MAAFLRLTQVLAIITIVISSPAIILGFGLLVAIPLAISIVVLGDAIQVIKTKKPPSKHLYIKYVASTLFAGAACVFGLLNAGSFANVDTTGKPSTGCFIGIAVACIYTVILLGIGYRCRGQLKDS